MSKEHNNVKKIINNKTIHFVLPGEIHRKLRAMLFLKESSMQSFFKLMSEKFIEGDQYILNLLDQRVLDIKNKKINNLKEINVKDLYNVIEENSPFKE
tara:strand:+ start:166 stop:459 length:294 start_codon:yes stop_codon:yes gene_type:complete